MFLNNYRSHLILCMNLVYNILAFTQPHIAPKAMFYTLFFCIWPLYGRCEWTLKAFTSNGCSHPFTNKLLLPKFLTQITVVCLHMGIVNLLMWWHCDSGSLTILFVILNCSESFLHPWWNVNLHIDVVCYNFNMTQTLNTVNSNIFTVISCWL